MVKFKDVDLEKLLQLMQEHGVSEITLKDGKSLVEVKRNREPAILQAPLVTQAVANNTAPQGMVNHPTMEAQAPKQEISAEAPPTEELPDNLVVVDAPLVGTFYRSPSPDDDPFVEVGDKVKNGDVLCIVEAMKSMNEIHAEVDGVITEICVENAELVEFEQPLFKIDTAG